MTIKDCGRAFPATADFLSFHRPDGAYKAEYRSAWRRLCSGSSRPRTVMAASAWASHRAGFRSSSANF